jgi:hypothetical protein
MGNIFVCSLFNDTAINSRLYSNEWFEKVVEGSGRGLIKGTVPAFA